MPKKKIKYKPPSIDSMVETIILFYIRPGEEARATAHITSMFKSFERRVRERTRTKVLNELHPHTSYTNLNSKNHDN